MERNSRDFISRARITEGNTEAVCDFLRSHSMMVGAPSAVIKCVHYPKWTMRERFDRYRALVDGEYVGGFGGLCSVVFTSDAACHAFYDAFDVYKSPTFGTNVTLACAFALLSHYHELEWAAEYGAVENLIRISIGLEERKIVLARVAHALKAAEDACR